MDSQNGISTDYSSTDIKESLFWQKNHALTQTAE